MWKDLEEAVHATFAPSRVLADMPVDTGFPTVRVVHKLPPHASQYQLWTWLGLQQADTDR